MFDHISPHALVSNCYWSIVIVIVQYKVSTDAGARLAASLLDCLSLGLTPHQEDDVDIQTHQHQQTSHGDKW